MASVNESLAGRIDERGFLKSLYRKGFTNSKCLLELVANTLDALDKLASNQELIKKLIFDLKDKSIMMIDNGYGMNREAAENMFAMHRENHEGDTSRGVSGIGAKPALSILSEKRTVQLFTRAPNGEYLRIIVPWDRIHSEGKYTGMISIGTMTEEEKNEYVKDRQDNQMISASGAHGTTIKFPSSQNLKRTIEDNFLPINEDSKPLDRIGIVFGRDEFECAYKHYEEVGNTRILSKYNYLHGMDDDFYRGKSTDTIEMWVTSDGRPPRFLWKHSDGKNYEIHSVGRGLSKNPEPCTINTNGYRKVGEFSVKTGLRKIDSMFDHEHPRIPDSASVERYINPYHIQNLGEGQNDFLASFKLVRNGQLIGIILPPDVKVSSARGNAKSSIETIMLQCEVSYNPVSSQDNHQDHAMNIQENKNQYDGESVDKRFTRIVAAIKKKKFADIWHYFETASRAVEVEVEVATESEEQESVLEEGEVSDETVGQEDVSLAAAAAAAAAAAPQQQLQLQPNTLLDFFRVVSNTQAEEETVSPIVDAEYSNPTVERPHQEVPIIATPMPIPVNVRPYRRGLVHGGELIQELHRVSAIIRDDQEYTDENLISLFNTLMNY